MSEPHDTGYPSIHLAARLSIGAWKLVSPLLPSRALSALEAFLKLVRPGRVVMVSLLTGVSAFVAKAPWREGWFIIFGGMFLAMAGFALDIYSDRNADKKSPRPWRHDKHRGLNNRRYRGYVRLIRSIRKI